MIITHPFLEKPVAPTLPSSSIEHADALWRVLAGEQSPCVYRERSIAGFPVLAIIDEAADSQFDALLQAFREGISLPASGAAIALRGQKFHGHHGRPWVAEPGNIHLTAWFSTDELPLHTYQAAMTMLPAVAALSAIKRVCPEAEPTIKWVNDVLVDDKKVSGVITSTQSRSGMAERVVYGIGMNVAKAPAAAPTSYVPTTGCLATHGEADMWPVLDVLLEELGRWHHLLITRGPASIVEKYIDHSLIIGRNVEVLSDPKEDQVVAAGRVLAIHPDLTLQIEGVDKPVSTGRLRLT